MTTNEKEQKLYEAIRQTHGYNKTGDELVDFVIDLVGLYEDAKRGIEDKKEQDRYLLSN